MKKFPKIAFALGSIFLCSQAAFAQNDPTTFLGPTLKGKYTSTFNNYTAYSVLGEAGVKNFRVGGTLGWMLQENQYLKFSAEYLWQDITYRFFSGSTDQWVNQGAIGAGYLYEFLGYSYDPHFDLNAYLSHAPSKGLGTATGNLISNFGAVVPYTERRRIAGSNGAGITPALSIAPWQGARAGLGLNYDNVRYDRKYAHNQDAKGLGGTFTFNQILSQNVDFDMSIGVRQPFNNYAAGLNFANVPYFGNWVLGVDGAYTAGKNTLPNTWNLSLSGSYALDQRSAPIYKDSGSFKDRGFKDPVMHDDLVKYTSDPAVYMPQVLAITDHQLNFCDLAPPTLTGIPIAPLTVSSGTTLTTPAAPAFSPSSGLVYAIASITPALASGDSITINPTTGVISATSGGGVTTTYTVIVTATNACNASASTDVQITLED